MLFCQQYRRPPLLLILETHKAYTEALSLLNRDNTANKRSEVLYHTLSLCMLENRGLHLHWLLSVDRECTCEANLLICSCCAWFHTPRLSAVLHQAQWIPFKWSWTERSAAGEPWARPTRRPSTERGWRKTSKHVCWRVAGPRHRLSFFPLPLFAYGRVAYTVFGAGSWMVWKTGMFEG